MHRSLRPQVCELAKEFGEDYAEWVRQLFILPEPQPSVAEIAPEVVLTEQPLKKRRRLAEPKAAVAGAGEALTYRELKSAMAAGEAQRAKTEEPEEPKAEAQAQPAGTALVPVASGGPLVEVRRIARSHQIDERQARRDWQPWRQVCRDGMGAECDYARSQRLSLPKLHKSSRTLCQSVRRSRWPTRARTASDVLANSRAAAAIRRPRSGPKRAGVLPGGYLNLWRGWGVEPRKGSWRLIERHIAEVLANGNQEFEDYIKRSTAWKFQNPACRLRWR